MLSPCSRSSWSILTGVLLVAALFLTSYAQSGRNPDRPAARTDDAVHLRVEEVLVHDSARCRYFGSRKGEEAAVIQVLCPELAGDERVARRFRDDLAALVGLSHPHLAEVRATGTDDTRGGPFAVLDAFAGRSLGRAACNGRRDRPASAAPSA